MKNKERKDGFIGVFIEIPKNYGQTKEELGMTWAGIIKLGIEAVEKNKRLASLVDTLDKYAKENYKLKQLLKNGEALDGRELYE